VLGCLLSHAPALRGWLADHIVADAVIFGDPMWATALRFEPQFPLVPGVTYRITGDFGKPLTTAFSDGRIRSIGHEEAGVAPATAFLDRINLHTIDGFDVRRRLGHGVGVPWRLKS